MQAMQDKDFDQLFKDRFEEAEIQPSSNLWSNIEQELAPKKKKGFPVYWAAAAVVVIATTIGLLSQKTEPLKLQGNAATAKVEKVPVAAPKLNTVVEEPVVAVPESTPLVLAPKVKLENLVRKNNQVAVQPNLEAQRQQVKEVVIAPEQKEEIKPIATLEKEVMIAKIDPPVVGEQNNQIAETEVRERKGIRNVGDVINFVVDKLDKREKKIIQFKTDDDDNSSLIAVNIGILKFNSKKNR
ncbi:hypothetical protein [Pedobacter caeni]|uniref:Uncharacterized protein n=1 Tax=Pedobacter caeni TaxID=288992 RepID=A0A1M4Z1T7_9SPHI|nr:hypothetical protein [Pedobacter caeni]SHF11960.1 hypothetical protein SAMN04488522_102153 [Pedobacter caeni]